MKVKLIGQVKSEAVKKEVEGLTDHELFCKKTGIRCLMKECCNEARRDFADKVKKHILDRIDWLNNAEDKAKSRGEHNKWLNRERELTFLLEWLMELLKECKP